MGRHSLPDPEDSGDESTWNGQPHWDDEPAGDDRDTSTNSLSSGDSESAPVDQDRSDTPYPWADEHPPETAPAQHESFDRTVGEEQLPDKPETSQQDPDGDDYPTLARRAARTPSRGSRSADDSPALGRAHRGFGALRDGHRRLESRRGVSAGIIVAIVAIVAVVGGTVLYHFFGSALSQRASSAAARCVGGNDTVAVLADPTIAPAVKDLADSYNSSAGPVGDQCVEVTVQESSADPVINGFAGKWPSALGREPGLWIPGSSISAARLAETVGKEAISDTRSLVTSPVVLALRPELAKKLSNEGWSGLPQLQSDPTALASLNLPGWDSLRLALPTDSNGDAAFLAGEAVAVASAPPGSPATAGLTAVRSLMSHRPKLADDTLDTAMKALLGGNSSPDDVAAQPVHAVVTTEQQVFQRAASLSDAKSTLAYWLPDGSTAIADYPTIVLSGPWLTREEATAASGFARYLRRPEQLVKLARAGFRVDDVPRPSSPVTDFPALSPTVLAGDAKTRALLAAAISSPGLTPTSGSGSSAATIMLDQSLPMDDGGKTRLFRVTAALMDRIKALPPTAVVGLWTFDGHEGRTEVTTGPLSGDVNGKPRSAELAATLDKQYSSNGGAVSFTTLRMIYQDVQAKFSAGQTNSVLVITSGPHTDVSLDGAGLQDFLRHNADPAKPIAVNVIDFGNDADRSTWEAVAQLTGGSYRNLTTSDSPDLAAAIATFVG